MIFNSGNGYGAQLSSKTAFGNGGYFEATMSFAPMPNAAAGAFWINDKENMVDDQPGNSWVEIDIAEFDNTNNTTAANAYQIQYHNWIAPVGSNNQNLGIPNGVVARVPSGTDWTKPHKYGLLWVPATASANGYLKFYFDGLLMATSATWAQNAPALSVIDNRHLVLILGTGGLPTTVSAVNVWQASAVGNVTGLR
jgi:hypothetical protein